MLKLLSTVLQKYTYTSYFPLLVCGQYQHIFNITQVPQATSKKFIKANEVNNYITKMKTISRKRILLWYNSCVLCSVFFAWRQQDKHAGRGHRFVSVGLCRYLTSLHQRHWCSVDVYHWRWTPISRACPVLGHEQMSVCNISAKPTCMARSALWCFLQALFGDTDFNHNVLNPDPDLHHMQPGVESSLKARFRGRVPHSVYRGKQRLLLIRYELLHSKAKYGWQFDIFDIS